MYNQINATVASSGTQSTPVAIPEGQLLCGLFIDPAMTSTTVTFEVSPKSGNKAALVSDGAGNSYTKTFRAGDFLPLDPLTFAGAGQVTFIFGTSEGATRNVIAVTVKAS